MFKYYLLRVNYEYKQKLKDKNDGTKKQQRNEKLIWLKLAFHYRNLMYVYFF